MQYAWDKKSSQKHRVQENRQDLFFVMHSDPESPFPGGWKKVDDGSNFFLTFGDLLANFERLALGCIETNLCK